MNITTRITGLLAGIACVLLSFSDAVAQPYGSISFETFYHELAPYGNWMHNPQYGQVWIPNVARGFRPYQTRGHWVMTEYGNTWVSDYAWGWAPFHYGRWHLDDYYGWMWVPGTEWGPAWVAWRSGGGYYGWAPLGPGLNVNLSINIGRRIPRPYWNFVRHRYITSPRIYDYCVPRRRVVNVINHTTIINNTYVHNNQHRYYSGPQRRDIERVTQRSVPVRRVQHARRPGASSVSRGSVAMYRPTVRGRQEGVGSSRSGRSVARGSDPTRSSFDRSVKRSTSPAVRSPRTRSEATQSRSTRSGTTHSMYDNRTDNSSRYQQRSSGSRQRSVSSSQSRERSTSSVRRQSRSVPDRSPSQRASSSRARSNSSRQRSTVSSSSRSGGSSPSMSSSRSSSRVQTPSRSSSSATRSSPSNTRSRSSVSSSSSSRSSAQTGRSRAGGSRSGSSRSRPQ